MKRDKLDTLFSELIRKRAIRDVGGCERCLHQKVDIVKDNGEIFPAWKQLQCSHFWGRGRQSVRFDEVNCCGLCGACHLYFTSHPSLHRDWFIKRLGEREFDLLAYRAQRPAKIDRLLIEIYLKEKIKEL